MKYFRLPLALILSVLMIISLVPSGWSRDYRGVAFGRAHEDAVAAPAKVKNMEGKFSLDPVAFTLSRKGKKAALETDGMSTFEGISIASVDPDRHIDTGAYARSSTAAKSHEVLVPDRKGSEQKNEGTSVGFSLRFLGAVLLHSHLVTLIKSPISSTFRLINYAVDTTKGTLTSIVHEYDDAPPPISNAEPMDLGAWEDKLDEITSGDRYRGSVKFLIDGQDFFSDLIQSINDAKKSIHIRINIFDTDDYAVKIADLLKEKSKEVKVKVLMCEMSSMLNGRQPPESPVPENFTFPASIEEYLEKDSRVHVRPVSNPWFTSDHTKTIIVDRKKAFIGGMNIGREYRYDWHDMMVELEGPVVGRLNKDFYRAWAHQGPTGDLGYAWVSLFRTERYRGERDRDDYIDVRPLYTKTGDEEIYRAQLAAIREARSYIYIENPYFTDDKTLNELIKARRRGVDVRVVLPAYTDSGLMTSSNVLVANSMIRNGIRVYIYPGMTHVKAAIYDGWACLGSANINLLSMRLNQETNIGISDPETVNRLKRDLFEVDFEKSKELKGTWDVSLSHYISETLLDIF